MSQNSITAAEEWIRSRPNVNSQKFAWWPMFVEGKLQWLKPYYKVFPLNGMLLLDEPINVSAESYMFGKLSGKYHAGFELPDIEDENYHSKLIRVKISIELNALVDRR